MTGRNQLAGFLLRVWNCGDSSHVQIRSGFDQRNVIAFHPQFCNIAANRSGGINRLWKQTRRPTGALSDRLISFSQLIVALVSVTSAPAFDGERTGAFLIPVSGFTILPVPHGSGVAGRMQGHWPARRTRLLRITGPVQDRA